MLTDRLVANPTANPDLALEVVLTHYSRMGYRKFEVLTGGAKAAFDVHKDSAAYRKLGQKHRVRFTSMHLPPITADLGTTLPKAIHAAQFAQEIGAEVMVFHALDRELFARAVPPFLAATRKLRPVPAIQNHFGTPLNAPSDVRAALEEIGDPRLAAALDVGQSLLANTPWREAADLLGERIALVHLCDQRDRRTVPFGTGEVDLPGLFARMTAMGYRGNFVVKMEVADRANALHYLADAVEYVATRCEPG